MEFILGYLSKAFDEGITKLTNLDYKSDSCILFQRLTVLLGDLIIFYAIKKYAPLIQTLESIRID